jgi:hypothetical protein
MNIKNYLEIVVSFLRGSCTQKAKENKEEMMPLFSNIISSYLYSLESYFCRIKILIGVPVKFHFSRILFSRKRICAAFCFAR